MFVCVFMWILCCFLPTTYALQPGLTLLPLRPTSAPLKLDSVFRLYDSPLHSFWTFDTVFVIWMMEDSRSRCVNCGISTFHIGRRYLDDEAALSIIRQWTSPQNVTASDHVCHACWSLINQELPGPSHSTIEDRESTVGHRHVCVSCGRSLLRIRFHRLRNDHSDRESHIYSVVSEWIHPQHVRETSCICHPCWQRADRVPRTQRSRSPQSLNTETIPAGLPTPIILPEYKRASANEAHCFVSRCQGAERILVTLVLRAKLLKHYNYYIPPNGRICLDHLNNNNWEFLNEAPYNENHSFNINYIQDMMSLLKSSQSIDFNNIDDMPDNLVHYWLGRTKQQYSEIIQEVPRLSEINRGHIGLTAYLIKLRTGDSYERMSTLMGIPQRTLSSLIGKVRIILTEDYVPRHLGLGHISRNEIARKNLLIPNALYGNVEMTKPIVIMDGTYIYVQKSSNYKYQKTTYSLHKYRNLVKTFMIVSTDGYIIEVLGPYPATTSDADIIKREFRDEQQPLRNYFQAGDTFILDKGFRDALPLLNECGYSVQKPEDVKEGETQLTTIDANKTRAVTICRWVVEVVNGRFKRDFKIFRQEYYNSASKNLYKDFTVAAALTNAFHPLITDRDDAGEILRMINRNMHVENTLSEQVALNQLNRRRTTFESINVDNNNLNDFPHLTFSELILVSLGTYQIKQARSYYGEHIREHGTYTIEVCREVPSSLLGELSRQNRWLLRGKIKSRHVSRKTYYVYILLDSSQTGRDAIVQYYCNCIVGKRTVGCCSHVMTIIWYLGWARYQDNIRPPAQHLDNIYR